MSSGSFKRPTTAERRAQNNRRLNNNTENMIATRQILRLESKYREELSKKFNQNADMLMFSRIQEKQELAQNGEKTTRAGCSISEAECLFAFSSFIPIAADTNLVSFYSFHSILSIQKFQGYKDFSDPFFFSSTTSCTLSLASFPGAWP